jgi:RNA polymerase sigma-70 factor (ECF subfamily)
MRNFKGKSDEEVVKFVRNQDTEAYSEIVDRYQEKLIRYVFQLLQNEDKAQDVVQDTLIKAYVNLRSFNSKKKFSSWIYRIAHNESINFIKKYKKEVLIKRGGWLENIEDSNKNIEEEFEKKELRDAIKKSIKKLPINYRSVVTLYFFEDKSYEEISDILRIPLGTVGTWLGRGKKMLAKLLRDNNKL